MGYTKQYGTTKDTYPYTGWFVDPVLVDGILDKEADTQYQDDDTDFVDEVFSDEFFEIGIVAFEAFEPGESFYRFYGSAYGLRFDVFYGCLRFCKDRFYRQRWRE